MSFVTLTILALAALLAAQRADASSAVWIAKPLASAGFIGAAIASGVLLSPQGVWLIVALVFCFVGDVLLIPKSKLTFLGGLFSFLLGHVFYVVLFLHVGVDVNSCLIAAALLLAPLALVARWLMPHVSGKMKPPVIAYMLVITVMVASAAGSWRQTGNAFVLGAAVAFYLSDLAVARERFIAPGFINRAWGLPLYYGAQLTFALRALPLDGS